MMLKSNQALSLIYTDIHQVLYEMKLILELVM